MHLENTHAASIIKFHFFQLFLNFDKLQNV